MHILPREIAEKESYDSMPNAWLGSGESLSSGFCRPPIKLIFNGIGGIGLIRWNGNGRFSEYGEARDDAKSFEYGREPLPHLGGLAFAVPCKR